MKNTDNGTLNWLINGTDISGNAFELKPGENVPGGLQNESGLVAYYPLDGDANDKSGNSRDLMIVGASLTSDRNGLSNGAYEFGSGII